MQPLDAGNGTVMSVNSWGYTTRAGMAGPKLHDNSAQLLFQVSQCSDLSSSARGVAVDPNNPPTCPPPSSTSSTSSTTTTTTAPPTTAPQGLTLTVDNYKHRGEKRATLWWDGETSSQVDIYRDDALVHTVAGDGDEPNGFTDETGEKGGGFTSWQVCEAGTATCSEVVTVAW
jgi:hypothetical protein